MSGRAGVFATFRVLASLALVIAGCGGATGSAGGVAGDGGTPLDSGGDSSGEAGNAAVDDAAVNAPRDASSIPTPPPPDDAPTIRPPCGYDSCPDGCCDADGLCQPGASDTGCGANGGACQTCSPGLECLACPPGAACPAARWCTCSPRSCPSGCCVGDTCQIGNVDTACGRGGAGCTDCTNSYGGGCANCRGPMSVPAGFAPAGGACSDQQCVYPPPSRCPFGCVDQLGACQPGGSSTECGSTGDDCQDCTGSGGQCSNQECHPASDAGACNSQTCPSGCCDSTGTCQQGLTSTVCGNTGANCQDCLSMGLVCSNQQCTAADGGRGCGWFNCSGCCDAFGSCVLIGSDSECGYLGSRCADCSKLGDRCVAGACIAPDGAAPCFETCAGCCDANGNCQGGSLDTQCGQAGASCLDCTGLSAPSTCDSSVSPRTCASQQTSCPATYPGCPAPLLKAAIAPSHVCSTADLEQAATACSGGASTPTCNAFFAFEKELPCGACLQGFGYDFVAQVGIRACALPYVDAACNHSAACFDDCVGQACEGCVVGSTGRCRLAAQSGTCAPYQPDPCVTQALGGPATLCDPATYQGNFGAWLRAVGAHYCGP